MTEDDIRRIIKEEIEKFLTVEFNTKIEDYDRNTSCFTINLMYKDELISTDYQIIKEG